MSYMLSSYGRLILTIEKTLILSIFAFQIPNVDPQGNEIPKWKREMMAKKAAEKAKGNDHAKFIYLSTNISRKLNFYLFVFL